MRVSVRACVRTSTRVVLSADLVVFSRKMCKKLEEVTEQVLHVADVAVFDEFKLLKNRLDKQHVAVEERVVDLQRVTRHVDNE